MKRINKLKLKKYQVGGVLTDPPKTDSTGVSNKAAAATETRNFNNITPMVDPKTGTVNWDLYNQALAKFPQGYNTAGDPTKKNPNEVNTVNYYVGNTITPAIKQRQEILNKQLAAKYGTAFNTTKGPTQDQFLTPEESTKALSSAKLGTYDDFLKYTNAYNSYRAKTTIAPTNTQGTKEDPNQVQNYGTRYYNLFTPVQSTNTQQTQTNQSLPQQAMGGRFGDLIGDIGKMGWDDVGNLANNFGKTMADTALTSIGLSNIIPNEAYKGGANNGKVANTLGGIGKAALPLALQTVGVPMVATRAAQQGLSMLNPQEQEQFSNGGMSNNPNAELEKQEVFQTPNGQVDQVNGPSHEEGGVPVNIPQGTRIWSDRLKFKGKTFAKHTAKFKTEKEEEALKDTTSSIRAKQTAQLNIAAKNKKLDELFMTQEGMKAKKINSYIKKYGGTQKFPNGGSFEDSMPETLEEIQAQMAMNSLNNSTGNGDFFNEAFQNPTNYPGAPTNYNATGIQQTNTPILPNQATLTPSLGNTQINPTVQTSSDNNQFIVGQGLNALQKAGNTLGENKQAIGRETTLFGMNNIANLAYLKNEGKRYDKVDYGSLTPQLMTDEESIKQIDQGYNTGLYNMKNTGNISQSGRIALAGERMKQGAAAKERIGNINTSIKNQFNQYNKNLQIQGMQDTAQNKGTSQSNYYRALGSLGQNSALQTKDYMQRAADAKKLNLIKDIFPDYTFDEKTFSYMYRLAQQQSK